MPEFWWEIKHDLDLATEVVSKCSDKPADRIARAEATCSPAMRNLSKWKDEGAGIKQTCCSKDIRKKIKSFEKVSGIYACICFFICICMNVYGQVWHKTDFFYRGLFLLVYEHVCICRSVGYQPSSIVVPCMKSLLSTFIYIDLAQKKTTWSYINCWRISPCTCGTVLWWRRRSTRQKRKMKITEKENKFVKQLWWAGGSSICNINLPWSYTSSLVFTFILIATLFSLLLITW